MLLGRENFETWDLFIPSGGENMTKLLLKNNANAWTTLSPDEVRHYLNGGVKTQAINGFSDEAATIPVYIYAHAIVFIYR
ncbi:MAG: hypothetical protein Q8910_00745 [Bacteroidota bacterium]|nr:hypothetical protein [Bacteroidota bacterium]